jgi:large subunit ribosomal protein L15
MSMNLHTLKPAKGSRRPKRRVGRGRASGMGKTSSRGHKGQYARSGHKYKPTFEGGQMPLVRRMPKRGFKNLNEVVYMPVNVGLLARFEDGTEVTVATLRDAGLANGSSVKVKVLGTGDLSRKLTVKAHAFSAVARQKIEAAGGTCEVIRS